MENLKIYTKDFHAALSNSDLFLLCDDDLFKINNEIFNNEKLSDFFKDILLYENAVIQNSEKLRYIFRNKRNLFFDFDKNVSEKFYALSADDFLNFDAFVMFALKDYKNRINKALYVLVKECLFDFPT